MAGETQPGAAQLRNMLVEHREQPMLLDEAGRIRTAHELVDRVDRLAGALDAAGLAGERVGVWYTNSIAAFEAYLAIEWMGATRIVLDPSTAPNEANRILAAGNAVATLVDAAHSSFVEHGAIVHDDDTPGGGAPRSPVLDVPADRPLHLYPRGVQGDVLHSVPISYGNWAATIELNCNLYRSGAYGPGWEESETLLTLQQLLHGTALMGSFPFLWMGLAQVVVSEFDAANVANLIDRFSVTATGMTSGMLSRVAEKTAEGRRPKTLRRVLYGGAPLSREAMQRAVDALGPVLVQVYGRLEGGWPLSILSHDDHAAILAGNDDLASSCGQPVPAPVEIAVRPVPGRTDGLGELCTRSAMVVEEYADPDGWCALGDLARLDHTNHLHLAGRLDDMINTGYHVYPGPIEEALRSIPGVLEAMVTGEPDERAGEVIAAYVVQAPGDTSLDPDAIRNALRAILAPYKVPRRISVVEELPVAAPS